MELWFLQHVKDPERFLYDLGKPIPGARQTVDDDTVREEITAFTAFSAAVGMTPPPATAEA